MLQKCHDWERVELCHNWLLLFLSLKSWSLKTSPVEACFSAFGARGNRNKDKQHAWTRSRKHDGTPLLLSNTKPQEKNPIRLIAVMCVGGVVISSGVISQLLWWTCEHETIALREASRSTLISWYGDGGDVSFDLAVTAREATQLADYLECKSQKHLPAQFNTFTLLHHEEKLCCLMNVCTFKHSEESLSLHCKRSVLTRQLLLHCKNNSVISYTVKQLF